MKFYRRNSSFLLTYSAKEYINTEILWKCYKKIEYLIGCIAHDIQIMAQDKLNTIWHKKLVFFY